LPKLSYYNTGPIYAKHPEAVHGRHPKDMIVLHETATPDYPGLKDELAVENYLVSKEYGIHGMTDKEGNIIWASGFGNAVFYQAGGVNERSIGIEQVFHALKDTPTNYQLWAARTTQLRATAKLVASICNTWNIPLRFSHGDSAGITSHWNISQIYSASEGHWDCHPRHLGGYYPILHVIRMAYLYRTAGYKL